MGVIPGALCTHCCSEKVGSSRVSTLVKNLWMSLEMMSEDSTAEGMLAVMWTGQGLVPNQDCKHGVMRCTLFLLLSPLWVRPMAALPSVCRVTA